MTDQVSADRAVHGHHDGTKLPPRPLPPVGLSQKVREVLDGGAMLRLGLAALSVLLIVAGAIFLLRPTSDPLEVNLQHTAGTAPASTIPVPPPDPARSEIVVHVVGAVERPGVYAAPEGARVHNLIERAGGAHADANLSGLNLAALITDGSQIYVPAAGESVPVPVAGSSSAAGVATSGPVDLNNADADALDTLPGVGPATARAIVDDRERNGPFSTLSDVTRVPGVGPAKVAAWDGLANV